MVNEFLPKYLGHNKVGIKLSEVKWLAFLSNEQLTDHVAKRVIKYVGDRQNKDGGYSFCRGTESNTQDTYYGL